MTQNELRLSIQQLNIISVMSIVWEQQPYNGDNLKQEWERKESFRNKMIWSENK